MAHFITEFKLGQSGGNKGLPMGNGLLNISRAINGVQKAMMYGIAASPKVGKSTFVDYGFVINPILYCIENNIPINVIYFSYEMDRVTKEFDFTAFFLFHDYGVTEMVLPSGVTYKGESKVPLSSNLLRGRIQDDKNNTITVNPFIEELVKKVYSERIVPFFGEYDLKGKLIKPGIIIFEEQKQNPTGIRNFLYDFAFKEGTPEYENYEDSEGKIRQKLIGYTPNDPNKYNIIVTDTIRKLPKERGYSMKENIDKYLEYSTECRNLFKMTFVHIVHLNRNMTDVNRLKFLGDNIFPTPEDIKDTGNLSEECNHLFTMFNPNDEKYNLDKHFGTTIRDVNKNTIYPLLRTAHLVESREVMFPQHFRFEMQGNLKNFSVFTEN